MIETVVSSRLNSKLIMECNMHHNSKPEPIKSKKLIPSDTYRDSSESHSKTRKQRRDKKRSQFTK